jgi:type II secretory pathway pseudopilin PulG
MGAFDWPGLAFSWVDKMMAGLPAPGRLAVWAMIAAALSMAIYRFASPQRRIAQAQTEAQAARHALDAFDGEFADAWPLIRQVLRTAVRRIGLVLPGVLLAMLPILAMLVWLSTSYGYRFPDKNDVVDVAASPSNAGIQGELSVMPHQATQPEQRRLLLRDQTGAIAAAIPLRQPVPVLEKRRWWHALIGNPAGYLPDDGAVDRVDIALPAQEMLDLGPAWLRGWEPLFFAVMLSASLAIKRFWRIA